MTSGWRDHHDDAQRQIFITIYPFHVHEIAAIRKKFTKWNYQSDGHLLIIAGWAYLLLMWSMDLYRNERQALDYDFGLDHRRCIYYRRALLIEKGQVYKIIRLVKNILCTI